MHFRSFLQVRFISTAADFVRLRRRFRRVLTSPAGYSTFVSFHLLLLAQLGCHFLLLVSVHFWFRCGLNRLWSFLLGWMLLLGLMLLLLKLAASFLAKSGRAFQFLPFQFTFRFFPLSASLVSQFTGVCLLLFVFQLLLLLLLQLLLFSQLFLFGYPLLLNQTLSFLSFLKFFHLFLLEQLLLLLQQHDLLLRIVFVV